MFQQHYEMPEMGSKGHRGWGWDRGRGGNFKGEEAVGTRGQTEGSRALWVGKWVGYEDSRRAVCTVFLWSAALHQQHCGNLRVKGRNKQMDENGFCIPTHS